MKILLAHNFYGSTAPSGENTVYLTEKELLQSRGHEIIEATRHSDEIRRQGVWGGIKGALSVPWNPFSFVRTLNTIRQERPAIMHAHNTFPLLSPAIFHAAARTATPTVLTLHNYRPVCAAAIPMRRGIPCTECIDRRSVIPSLRYGCYRQSRLATLPLATAIALHRKLGTWKHHVDSFIVLTEFQRELMIEAGFPADRLHIKPHFYPDAPTPLPWSQRDDRVIFIGRLGEEKGVRLLPPVWHEWGAEAASLEIIGEGPLRGELEVLAGEQRERILFSGQLPFSETQTRLAKAKLLVLPSLCFEGFPMVIREAFALGVPVVASDLGAMSCLIDPGVNGRLFPPGRPDGLLRAIRTLWEAPALLEKMSLAARRTYESEYGADANFAMLMDIYSSAIEHRKGKKLRGYEGL